MVRNIQKEKLRYWKNWAYCSLNIYHFLRNMWQHNVIIFKVLPMAMWISLPFLRCFANISLLGQATDSICAQLSPHNLFDKWLFFSFSTQRNARLGYFHFWWEMFHLDWRTVTWQTSWCSFLVIGLNFREVWKWPDNYDKNS